MKRRGKNKATEMPAPCEVPAPPEFAGGMSCPAAGDAPGKGGAAQGTAAWEGGADDGSDGHGGRHGRSRDVLSDQTVSGARHDSGRAQPPGGRRKSIAGHTPAAADHENAAAPPSVPREKHLLRKLFWSFLKIGLFTFGGGYAMIPLIQREVTGKRKWVDPAKFLELLTLAQSAPGPISLNTAVFVGYNLKGYKGAAAAILGTILPSFAILLLVAMYFSDIKDNRVVEAIFKGMRPAVVALIVAPLVGFTKGMGPYRIGVAILVAAAIWRLGASPALFILIGAAGGLLWAWLAKRKEARG